MELSQESGSCVTVSLRKRSHFPDEENLNRKLCRAAVLTAYKMYAFVPLFI